MADPFEVLHHPVEPIDPDPTFAARLRARIEQAMDLPRGATMSTPTVDPEPADASPGGPRHGDIGYVSLWVPDVERAASFFSAVLGWRYAAGGGPRSRQVEGAATPHGLWGGEEHSTLFLCFAVDDVGLAVDRVRGANGRAETPRPEPYGLVADCVDDQGMPFALVEAAGASGPRRPVTGTRQGDLAYVVMEVVDSSRTRAFFGSVLGWTFRPGNAEGGWEVADVAPMVGMIGGGTRATIVPMYRVDDVGAAVERVRAAGGTATDPERQPYGVTAVCNDDQGARFYLGEL